MKGKFLFLGSGGSLGIPIVTCTCAVCKSSSPFNKRLRPSGLLTIGEKSFLIDVGPDFRDQALRYGIKHLDGILLTHTHYDHVGGLDEVRVFYFLQKQRIPILSSKETFEEVEHRYHYLFRAPPGSPNRCPQFEFELLKEDFGQITFVGEKFDTVSYFQAGMKVTGYRIGNFAYISDIRHYDDLVVERLQGVEILVVSALRESPSEVHFSLEEAAAFSHKVGARTTFLTHITHDLDHDETNAKLPKGIALAHDGLEIEIHG
ncbi:MAG: Phosphoribosyl 1,2-cyclic phosphodiesterase [Chlamydiae bacterium]|nr:Phosphoribosyl 1,2-cyclic phosphodiesterase [Chlamydiota bacterium]